MLEFLRTVACNLQNGSWPVNLPCPCITVIHQLSCLLGSNPVPLLTFPGGFLSFLKLGDIQHHTYNAGYLPGTVFISGFVEKEISLHSVGTDHLGFVIM